MALCRVCTSAKAKQSLFIQSSLIQYRVKHLNLFHPDFYLNLPEILFFSARSMHYSFESKYQKCGKTPDFAILKKVRIKFPFMWILTES